jgi:hypothetical protein
VGSFKDQMDSFFKEWIRFSGFDRSFGYWTGLSGIGLIFQELDAMIFLRIGLRIGWIGFFKGWNLFSQIGIKNG